MTVDTPHGNFIQSTQEMILRFTAQVSLEMEQWTKQLIDRPADLEAIDRAVHQRCSWSIQEDGTAMRCSGLA